MAKCDTQKAAYEAAKVETQQAQAVVNRLCMDLATAQMALMAAQSHENQKYMEYQQCLSS